MKLLLAMALSNGLMPTASMIENQTINENNISTYASIDLNQIKLNPTQIDVSFYDENVSSSELQDYVLMSVYGNNYEDPNAEAALLDMLTNPAGWKFTGMPTSIPKLNSEQDYKIMAMPIGPNVANFKGILKIDCTLTNYTNNHIADLVDNIYIGEITDPTEAKVLSAILKENPKLKQSYFEIKDVDYSKVVIEAKPESNYVGTTVLSYDSIISDKWFSGWDSGYLAVKIYSGSVSDSASGSITYKPIFGRDKFVTTFSTLDIDYIFYGWTKSSGDRGSKTQVKTWSADLTKNKSKHVIDNYSYHNVNGEYCNVDITTYWDGDMLVIDYYVWVKATANWINAMHAYSEAQLKVKNASFRSNH